MKRLMSGTLGGLFEKYRVCSLFAVHLVTFITLSVLLLACADYPCERNAFFGLRHMQQDIRELQDLIIQNHPLNFASEQNVRESFEDQYAELKDSMTLFEFHRIIAKAVSSVNCGHTRLSLPECVQDDAYLNGNTLPLEVKVVHDSLIILKTFDPEQILPEGSIILSINDKPTGEIINQIKSILPTDGTNEAYKYFQMNQDFNRRYMEAMGELIEFEIEYIIHRSSEIRKTTVSALTLAEINEHHRTSGSNKQTIETSIDKDNSFAILRLRFFDYYDNLNEFAHRIDSFFHDIAGKRIESLILDLRGNDGGDPYTSAYLLGYLIGEPFTYFAPHSTFLLDDLKNVQQIPENPFKGELYLLIDGGCYSTTGHFLSLLRNCGKGIFIGEETGGSYMCNGGFREHRLHNSGIELLLPHATFIANASGLERGRGITPDLFTDYSVNDVINNNDPILDAALAIIHSRN